MKNKENNLIISNSILDDVKSIVKKAKDKKIIRPCTDAFKNNPVELEKYKGKTSYFYN
mgnify:FL=1